jgi:hypothetical protein
MFERFPLLTFLLMILGVMVFAFGAVWLWLEIGLISASLVIIGLVIALPWFYQHRPRFLGGGQHGHA